MMPSLVVEKCFPICKLKNHQSLSYKTASSILVWGKTFTTEEDSNLKLANAENSSCSYFMKNKELCVVIVLL
jgi:hypothetical protein